MFGAGSVTVVVGVAIYFTNRHFDLLNVFQMGIYSARAKQGDYACKAAGRGSRYGQRGGASMTLWRAYCD